MSADANSLMLSDEIMIMRPKAGVWYPIQAVKGKALADQAREHGELNKHLARIEDVNGNVLWRREN